MLAPSEGDLSLDELGKGPRFGGEIVREPGREFECLILVARGHQHLRGLEEHLLLLASSSERRAAAAAASRRPRMIRLRQREQLVRCGGFVPAFEVDRRRGIEDVDRVVQSSLIDRDIGETRGGQGGTEVADWGQPLVARGRGRGIAEGEMGEPEADEGRFVSGVHLQHSFGLGLGGLEVGGVHGDETEVGLGHGAVGKCLDRVSGGDQRPVHLPSVEVAEH